MSINELINNGANTAIIISANDLKEFAANVVAQTRKDIEKEVVERTTEVFYSIDQVCKMLNVDASTLWRWNKRKYLAPIAKVGRHPRYRKSDIDRILGVEGGK